MGLHGIDVAAGARKRGRKGQEHTGDGRQCLLIRRRRGGRAGEPKDRKERELSSQRENWEGKGGGVSQGTPPKKDCSGNIRKKEESTLT